MTEKEKGKTRKVRLEWALGHDYMEASPVCWRTLRGFPFHNSFLHSTSGQRRQAIRPDQCRKALLFVTIVTIVTIVCADCTLEALRGVKRNRELQEVQSLNFEPPGFPPMTSHLLLAASPNPTKSPSTYFP